MDPLLFIEQFKNFEKLCPELENQYRFYREESELDENLHSILPYKDIQQLQERIDTLKPFDGIEPFDMTRRKEIADNLNIFYRKILHQPFWYLEAVELYPDSLPLEDKLFERAKSVFYRVEHAEDKFNEMIFSVNRQLNDLVDSDKESAIKLFNKILFNMDNLLLSVGRNSFDQWYFDYKRSPLFVFLMEYIQQIKNRAGNSAEYYPQVETYLNNLNTYKIQFSTNSAPDSQPDNKNVQSYFENSMPEMQYGVKKIKHIDYLEIILAGSEDKNTRQFLPEYIYREFKKAEKDDYGVREFFNGLLDLIDYFESNMKLQYSQRRNELLILKSAAENKTIKIIDYNNPKTYEQLCIDTIENCENELLNNKLESYRMSLDDISNNKHSGILQYSHVIFIKKAIMQAKQKVLDSLKQESNSSIKSVQAVKPINTSNDSSNFDKFITEITHLEIRISETEDIYSLDHYLQFARFHFPDKDEPVDFEFVLQYDTGDFIEHAVSDILNLNDGQINKQIHRVQNVKKNLNEFLIYYSDLQKLYDSGGKLTTAIFMFNLSKYFRFLFPDGKIESSFSDDFIQNLLHAANYKIDLIDTFLSRLNNLVKIIPNSMSEVVGLNSNYSDAQLLKMFSRLQNKKIVIASDKENFLNMFNDKFSGQVHWNDSIYKAKAGLFDLLQRITRESMSASTLKKYFITSDKTIHDKWRLQKQTTLIDEILSGI